MRPYRIWLGLSMLMVILMMIIGAITRLTESGLSMVEWRPFIGWIPPLSTGDWQRIFELYQQTSQYQLMNKGMSLADFQTIFWWEYIHRVFGRLIGVVYALPFLYWAVRNRLPVGYRLRLFLLLGLGGLQGVIGWWMVKSGFVDRTEVSQIRLAVHLGVAFIILGLIYWVWLDMGNRETPNSAQLESPFLHTKIRHFFALAPITIIGLTLLAGALVAGLRAGFIYNDWPTMDGALWPSIYWDSAMGLRSLYEDYATVQMNHRIMAYLSVLTCFAVFAVAQIKSLKQSQHNGAALMIIVIIQLMLGVATLMLVVPIWLGALHQFTAILLYLAALNHCYKCYR